MERKEIWLRNYNLLKQYIAVHHQLPDKKKVENRGLLNWWKYNMKRVRAGKVDKEKMAMLKELSEQRTVRKDAAASNSTQFLPFQEYEP